MARVFLSGSTDGLGLAAARTLVDEGHEVVLHARTRQRASEVSTDLGPVVIGDLSSAAETRELAGQVNDIGHMDAVILNAGIYVESTGQGRPRGTLGR